MQQLLKILPEGITEQDVKQFFTDKGNPNPELDALSRPELEAIAKDITASKSLKKRRVKRESLVDLTIVLRGNGFNLNEQQVKELAIESGRDPNHLVKGDIDAVVKFAIDRSNQETAIAPVSKTQLVKEISQDMGVVLSVNEITTIAGDLDEISGDLSRYLQEIRIAVIDYIKHKAQQNSQIIRQTFQEISEVATSEMDRNSEELVKELQQISSQIRSKNTDFKRTLRTALSTFKLSDSKTKAS